MEDYDMEPGFEENNNVNKTDISEKIRRNYPKYNNSLKSEWIGIVHHQQEINDELAKLEKEIKLLTAKGLSTAYEKNLIALFEKKKRDLLIKQREAEEMLEKRKLYDQDVNQYKHDKILRQNQVSDTYNQLVQEKEGIMKKYKDEEMGLERSILEENFRKLEENQREMQEKKEKEKCFSQLAIQEREKMKLRQNFDQLKSKNEINELNKMSEMKQLIKDENYKNFFQICADNQTYYQNLHKSNVLSPFLEKQNRQKDIIEKNFSEANNKKFQSEFDRLRKKQEDNVLAKSVNQMQILEHQKMKEMKKLEKQAYNEARLQDIKEYSNFLNYKKNEKQQKMLDYKEKLDSQFDQKKNEQLNNLRMTKNEKRLNYNDLQAYKEIDPSMYAMIPGWTPQVGALKFQKPQKEPEAIEEARKPVFSPTLFSAKVALNANNKPILTDQGISKTDFNHKKETLLYGHNPILNPMPYNIQNPYLANEFNLRKNVLSQMGRNSLI